MERRLLVALGWVALAASACGGNVVVDHGGAGASGQGGGVGPGGGSSGNVCEQAQKFIEKCASESTASGPPPTSCTGATACTSQCLLNSSCSALDGSDKQAGMALGSCLQACTGTGG